MRYWEAYYSHVFWRFTWGHEEVLSCTSYLSLPPNQLKINIWLVTWNLWNTVASSNTSGPCDWPQIMLPYRTSASGSVTIPELWVLTKKVSCLWAGILDPLRAYLNYVRFFFYHKPYSFWRYTSMIVNKVWVVKPLPESNIFTSPKRILISTCSQSSFPFCDPSFF